MQSKARATRKRLGIASSIALVVVCLVALMALSACSTSKTESEAAAKKSVEQGMASFKKGDFKAAIGELKKTVADDPENPRAQLLLGQSYEATGKLQDAAQAYEASIRAQPRQPEALHNLALIYKAENRLDDAIKSLKKALAVNKDFVGARLALSELYAMKNEKEKARAELQEVIDMKPFGVDIDRLKKKLETIN